MKKYIYLISLILVTVGFVNAQAIRSISARCPKAIGGYSSVQLANDGNIEYTPCSTKTNIFTGPTSFSGSTTFLGALFTWSNAANDATFYGQFRPSKTGNGLVNWGDPNGQSLIIDEFVGLTDFRAPSTNIRLGDVFGTGNGLVFQIDNSAGEFDFNGSGGIFVNGAGTGSSLYFNNAVGTIGYVGPNSCAGSGTIGAGGTVTISSTCVVNPSDHIFCTYTSATARTKPITVTAKVANTSFSVNGDASQTFDWFIVHQS